MVQLIVHECDGCRTLLRSGFDLTECDDVINCLGWVGDHGRKIQRQTSNFQGSEVAVAVGDAGIGPRFHAAHVAVRIEPGLLH